MKLNFRPSSLSSDFFLFSMIIFMVVVMLPIAFWYEIYKNEVSKKYDRLPDEARRISLVLIDSMDYTAKYAQFLGERILQRPNDLQYIADMVSGKFVTQSHEQNLYTTTFDWVTPDKMLRVSSKQGVLERPFDMSDRDYLSRTPLKPWTFQLSKPRLGGLSGEWIIPAGMGITNRDGTFLGSITLGFSVQGLTRRISEILGKSDLRYLVLNDDRQVILDSKNANNQPGDLPKLNIPALPREDQPSLMLPSMLHYDGVDFAYYHKVEDSPYILLVGYDDDMASDLFNLIVLSRVVEFTIIALAAFLMLYLMRRRLVKPVTQLAKMAEGIVEGRKVPLIGNDIREIAVLDRHLQRIAAYVENEHRILTELMDKTHALEEANAEAVAAAEAARRADRAKSEFLANMSHELRTPMNAVIGLTNILLSKSYPPEKEKECLHVMHSSAEHLMQLINDLLDVSKLEDGKLAIEQIPFNLLHVVEEVVSINEVQARQKHIDIEIRNQLPGLPELLGDPLRIRQIVMNLVGNAVKFTQTGSVVVELSGKRHEDGHRFDINIAVIDTGIGISEDKLESIFDKFTQADSSINRTHGGTGLGLSISRMLAHSMMGSLVASSTPGNGSRFTLELSLPVALPAGAQEAAQSPADEPVRNKLHVLLAEDNAGNILVATTLLDSCGYSYDVARNGAEAIEKLLRTRYDLVLMDVQMPEMDGLEVTRRWREHEMQSGSLHVPIIGMTAYALAGDRARCIKAGMDEYISKPFDPVQLTSAIRKLTEAGSANAA